MKTSKETSDIVMNPTLRHLLKWIGAIDTHLNDKSPFENIQEYANSLERWRAEFCEERDLSSNGLESHWGDLVKVSLYGDEVILISDERSGEFIKLTKVRSEVTSV